jgi:FMN phosphatase YigB (HAD superfamily)
MPDSSSQIPALQQQYYKILNQLGISPFFRPRSRRVTLSTEVGVRKPDKKIFNAAIKKVDKRLGFQDAIFITENISHIEEARRLGMTAIHFKGPTQATGEVEQLLELIPLIKQFVEKPM